MENHEKLVRDKIPDRIRAHGEVADTRVATPWEMTGLLNRKLREEVDEFLASPNPEEMADILEVLDALRKFAGWSEDEVIRARARKLAERGGFEKGIVLRVTPPG